VITSRFGLDGPQVEGSVHRVLSLHGEIHGASGVLRLARESLRDGRAFRAALRELRPEVLLIGNYIGLSSALWNVLRRCGIPLVLDVSNNWLVELCSTHGNWFRIWEARSRSRSRGALKRLVRGLLALGPRATCTRFPGLGAARVYATAGHLADTLRERCGDRLPPVEVCPSGIDLAAFPYRPAGREVTRLLYVGRLKETKGVHTAIAAMEHLDPVLTLTIVGPEVDPGYARTLRERAAASRPAGRVELREPVGREEIPALFAEHDALLFPSEWEEPFSRLVLEALACGIPVVSTPRGGTADVIRHGENGLLFEAGEPEALARQVRRLAGDDAARRSMIDRGRGDVEERYGLATAVDRVERILLSAAEGA
jgi:glycosyltransferase involved in cell wall biosynthesis